MKLNPPNAHRSQIKICEKRQTRNVQFRFMPNAFRILKPIQKSSKCIWVFRSTGANAFAKNQTRLAYEDKRDLYCTSDIRRPDTPKLLSLRIHSQSRVYKYVRAFTVLLFYTSGLSLYRCSRCPGFHRTAVLLLTELCTNRYPHGLP